MSGRPTPRELFARADTMFPNSCDVQARTDEYMKLMREHGYMHPTTKPTLF